MNALAPRIAAMQPDLAAIEGVILLIEDGARASRDLDAAVFEALGWHVTRACITDPRRSWTVLSPLSTAALPLPRASKRIDCAKGLVPPAWDWGVGERSNDGTAWCHNRRRQGDSRLLWFEAKAATPALALTKVALHAQRALLAARVAARALDARRLCACGWTGPLGALRPRRDSLALFCPDCDRPAAEIAA